MTQVTAPRVLFIRGGDRTGGFLEAGNDASRTEHLGDINNFTTGGGNHGWGELRNALVGGGFVVEQITEGSETASGPADGHSHRSRNDQPFAIRCGRLRFEQLRL